MSLTAQSATRPAPQAAPIAPILQPADLNGIIQAAAIPNPSIQFGCRYLLYSATVLGQNLSRTSSVPAAAATIPMRLAVPSLPVKGAAKARPIAGPSNQ